MEIIINLKPKSEALTSVDSFKERVIEGFEVNMEGNFGHFEDFEEKDWRNLLSDVRVALNDHDEISLMPIFDTKAQFTPVVDVDFAVGKKKTRYISNPDEIKRLNQANKRASQAIETIRRNFPPEVRNVRAQKLG